jgi:alanine racemase
MTRVAPNPLVRLEVEQDAIAHNYRALRALLPDGVLVAGVVKADAYGHGLVAVGRTLKREGAELLAVVSVDEARTLRDAGVEGPIMLLMGVPDEDAALAVELELVPVIDRAETLEALSQAAVKLGRTALCHVKLDSGMGRLGVSPDEALALLAHAEKLPSLEVAGLASHLATSGAPGDEFALKQARVYEETLRRARDRGFALPHSSLNATGGTLVPVLSDPAAQGIARLGIGLYGALPDPASKGRAELRGAMSFSTRLHAIKTIPAGATVSYGCTWTATRDCVIGVLPAGYSDGYPRAASNRGFALFRGARVPIRGRVCMNMIMIELTDFTPAPELGEEVVLLGRQGADEITLDELGGWAGTISYEVACSLGAANYRD